MSAIRHLPEPRTFKERLHRARFTVLRRAVSLGLLALMASSARFGWNWLSGDLSASLWFGILPFSDPFATMERLMTGIIPTASVLLGSGIATLFYAAIGSRAFCGWICPMNVVTETASWLRRHLSLTAAFRFPNWTRYALAVGIFGASAATGSAAFEPWSPQGLLWRDLVWGTGLSGFSAILGITALELGAGPSLWCSRLCPMGAFWATIGRLNPKPLIRIRFVNECCTHCGDCIRVCPEQQIIDFKSMAKTGTVPSGECLLCGRCISICPENALRWSSPLHVSNHKESSL